MTVEEIYIKLRDELTADNDSSSSPERIFIKNEEQTICTLGMNRSHEIIFVEFKPASKDLSEIEREGFVHPHPVEMLHDAGWRQAQITSVEEAEKLLDIIHRSYKKKRSKSDESPSDRESRIAALKKLRQAKEAARQQLGLPKGKPGARAKTKPEAQVVAKEKPAKKAPAAKRKVTKPASKSKPQPKPKAKAKAAKPKPKAVKKAKPAKKKAAKPAKKKKR